MDPEGEMLFTNQMIFAMDMLVYGVTIIMLAIFILLFLVFIKAIREKYPRNGKKGLSIAYLLMGILCFHIGMPYVALIWALASGLMLLDHHMNVKKEK